MFSFGVIIICTFYVFAGVRSIRDVPALIWSNTYEVIFYKTTKQHVLL